MRIESSVTGMESERSFNVVNYSARSVKATLISGKGGAENKGNPREGSSFLGTLFEKYGQGENVEAKDKTAGEDAEKEKVSVSDIMSDMMAGRIQTKSSQETSDPKTDAYVRNMSVLYIFSLLFEEFRDRINEMMSGFRREYESSADGGEITAGYQTTENYQTYRLDFFARDYTYEEEETSFKAKGKAICADGREIDFNIGVKMSRSFESLSEQRLAETAGMFIDPLVINLNEGVTNVSDQDFYFDLDSDGKEEKIGSLAEGSGFLALDKNGDGRINDGSELFGTKSGDGFADLAKFDDDHDGWIDEDDAVFDRLKIWVREKGGDRLLSLKEAGVGALNLGRAETEFSLKDINNRSKAVVRSTGMFLYEDGRAGVMQQIDMVS